MDNLTKNRFLSLNKEISSFSSFNPSDMKGLLNIHGEGVIESEETRDKKRILTIHGEVYLQFSPDVDHFSSEIKIKVQDLILGRRKEFLIISSWIILEELRIERNHVSFLVLNILSWLEDKEELEYFYLLKLGNSLNERQKERLAQLSEKIDFFKRERQEHYLAIKNMNLNVGGGVDLF